MTRDPRDRYLQFFATAAKGAEALLVDELQTIAADAATAAEKAEAAGDPTAGAAQTTAASAGVTLERGGVSFDGPLALGYRACLWSRLAQRVLLRLVTLRLDGDPETFWAGLAEIDWSAHLSPDGTLETRQSAAQLYRSRLTHHERRATKSFEQCYNGQVAVDGSGHQIIVAALLTQHTNDKQELQPLIVETKANLDGAKPKRVSADSGYYSEDNVNSLTEEKIDGYIATGRLKHIDQPPPAPRGRIPKAAMIKERMARKLCTIRGSSIYTKRKGIVEPVFGQIKQVRGFRQLLLRGYDRVSAEWKIICLGHNLLKLFRSGYCPHVA